MSTAEWFLANCMEIFLQGAVSYPTKEKLEVLNVLFYSPRPLVVQISGSAGMQKKFCVWMNIPEIASICLMYISPKDNHIPQWLITLNWHRWIRSKNLASSPTLCQILFCSLIVGEWPDINSQFHLQAFCRWDRGWNGRLMLPSIRLSMILRSLRWQLRVTCDFLSFGSMGWNCWVWILSSTEKT